MGKAIQGKLICLVSVHNELLKRKQSRGQNNMIVREVNEMTARRMAQQKGKKREDRNEWRWWRH